MRKGRKEEEVDRHGVIYIIPSLFSFLHQKRREENSKRGQGENILREKERERENEIDKQTDRLTDKQTESRQIGGRQT